MKKDKAIIKTAIEQKLVERSQVFFWLALSSIGLITTILIWQAVYRANQQIGSYNLKEIITYSFLAFLLRRASIATHWRISHNISSGKINNYLLLPYHYLRYRLLSGFGSRLLANTLLSLPVFIALIWIYKQYILGPKNIVHIAILFLVILPMTVLLNYLYTSIIGLTSFWTTEATGSFYLVRSIANFLGGAMFPISAFPGTWQFLLKALPFRYLFSFPIDFYLGKINTQQLGRGLIVQFLWLISFYIILKIVWYFGIRRHEAYGG